MYGQIKFIKKKLRPADNFDSHCLDWNHKDVFVERAF